MQEKMPEESAEMDMSEFKELWDDDAPIPGYF
jgi:calmodulin-binding transcription activator